MIRPILFTLAVLLTAQQTEAQNQALRPVTWTFEIAPLGEHTYELICTAHIDVGWHVYSQHLEDESGPIPTGIYIEEPVDTELVGDATEEGQQEQAYDPVFQMNLVKYRDEAIFRQKVRVTPGTLAISGYVEYMCCDNEKCLPPTEAIFRFEL